MMIIMIIYSVDNGNNDGNIYGSDDNNYGDNSNDDGNNQIMLKSQIKWDLLREKNSKTFFGEPFINWKSDFLSFICAHMYGS